jgi:hypothetical protein
MVTQLYNASWWGAGEPVAITALPRHHHTEVGRPSGPARRCTAHQRSVMPVVEQQAGSGLLSVLL